jgi:Fe-S cluster assembly protein SufD
MSEQFLASLQQHFNNLCEKDSFAALRKKGWQQFLNGGLPDKSHEAYRYVSLRELYALPFECAEEASIDKSQISSAILPECQNSHLVFIDGCFSAELSDLSAVSAQITLLKLDDALRSHSSFLQNHFSRLLKEENDPFALMNLALHPKGAFFYLPTKIEILAPIQCLHVTTGANPQSIFPRLYLVLGAQSQMRLIETHLHFHSEISHFAAPLIEVSLEEGAHLHMLSILDNAPKFWLMGSVRASIKKNARFDSFYVTTGARIARQNYRVQLKGENSEANLNGLWMLKENCTTHIHAIVDHEAPHTRSMQTFKGVLNDVSQSSFEGKILVRKEAQKTEAYQLNNNLILSQGAIANSKPNLEVFADDVKASHGATVSQLDEEQLFYLNTRGISGAEARRLLISGFCREMIDRIPYASILQKMQKHILSIVN